MKERLKAKNSLHEQRIRSIEFRLLSQTPTDTPGETPSPPKPVPRSKSFSKTSRVKESGLLDAIKSKILAHEPTLLTTPSPKKKNLDLSARFLRRCTMNEMDRFSLTPTDRIKEKNASFVVFERKPGMRPNAFLQSEMMRAGVLKPNWRESPLHKRTAQPLTPTQKTSSLLEDNARYGNEWEMRKRKEHLKQMLRNMKRLEVSKRNLWKNKAV